MPSRHAIGIAVGALILLVFDALAVRIGLLPGVIPKLAGPSLWVISRAAGVSAFVALTLDVVFGLFLSTRWADRVVPRGTSIEIHRWLSTASLLLVAAHALALLGDRVVPFDLLDVLVPFVSSYRSLAVALGVLAAYGAIAVHASFAWRKQLGQAVWRKLHYVSFFVYVAALVHAVTAGSDTATAGMQALYLGSAATVSALVAYRLAAPQIAGLGSA